MMEYEITHGEDWYDDAPAGAPGANPLLVVHRCLRGRYPLALLLAALLAVPMAVLGYIAVPPEYTSQGIVHISPTQQPVLYQIDFNEPMSTFDSYVQSQANLIRSWRVIQFAAQSTELLAAGWPAPPAGTVALMEGLSVQVPTRSQDIFVNVSHAEPRLAKAAVDAVLASYSSVSIEGEQLDLNETITKLTELVNSFDAAAKRATDEAFRIAEQEGTDDLERRRAAKHEQVEMLEKLILDYEIRLVPYKGIGESDSAAGDARPEVDRSTIPPEVLAQTDRTMARLLDQRRALELEIESLSRKYAPEHRAVLGRKDELETIGQMIQAQAAFLAAQPQTGDPAAMALTPADTARQLRAQLAELRRLRDATDEQAKRLGKLQLQINLEREKASRAEEQLQFARERLNALEVERRNGSIGRISIPQTAYVPLKPSTDRRVPLAVLGALGGSGLGVGIVALLGLVFPKYRYIGDLNEATRNVFVFGAVPELDATDPESRELVAASVHQVRSVIDARLLGTSDRALVHVVTSAGAAEGKSTIALRLAKSFAATGRKTLLIDSDMIGRRLSAEFGLLDASGFADAVTALAGSGQTVHPTPVRDLFIMPAGRTDRVDPEQVSARRAGDLLTPLQQTFQAIVIDTGPILGSLEAQAVSAIADEVMLVITRGREVRQVKLAIDRLHRLGARKIGVVFNRATRHDVERSTSISVTSQRTAEVRAHWRAPDANGDAQGGDLIARGEEPARN